MTTEPRLTLIESPYAGDVEGNLAYARRCVADSLSRGEAPFAGHIHYTQPGILYDNKPEERKLGMGSVFIWAERAGASRAFYLDLGVSGGMLTGLRVARSCGARVIIRWLDPKFEMAVIDGELDLIEKLFVTMVAARAK